MTVNPHEINPLPGPIKEHQIEISGVTYIVYETTVVQPCAKLAESLTHCQGTVIGCLLPENTILFFDDSKRALTHNNLHEVKMQPEETGIVLIKIGS